MKKRASLRTTSGRVASPRAKTPAKSKQPHPIGLIAENGVARDVCPVHLEFFNPEARSVAVAGTFNNWLPESCPAQPGPDGHWTVDLELKPGVYEYRMVVDGQWVDDPLACGYVANPFGGLNCLLTVH